MSASKPVAGSPSGGFFLQPINLMAPGSPGPEESISLEVSPSPAPASRADGSTLSPSFMPDPAPAFVPLRSPQQGSAIDSPQGRERSSSVEVSRSQQAPGPRSHRTGSASRLYNASDIPQVSAGHDIGAGLGLGLEDPTKQSGLEQPPLVRAGSSTSQDTTQSDLIKRLNKIVDTEYRARPASHLLCDRELFDISNIDKVPMEETLQKVVRAINFNIHTQPLSARTRTKLDTLQETEKSSCLKGFTSVSRGITTLTSVPMAFIKDMVSSQVVRAIGYSAVGFVGGGAYIACKFVDEYLNSEIRKAQVGLDLLYLTQTKAFEVFGQQMMNWWGHSTPLVGNQFTFEPDQLEKIGITLDMQAQRKFLRTFLITDVYPRLCVAFGVYLDEEYGPDPKAGKKSWDLPDIAVEAWQRIKNEHRSYEPGIIRRGNMWHLFEGRLRDLHIPHPKVDEMLLGPRDSLRAIYDSIIETQEDIALDVKEGTDTVIEVQEGSSFRPPRENSMEIHLIRYRLRWEKDVLGKLALREFREAQNAQYTQQTRGKPSPSIGILTTPAHKNKKKSDAGLRLRATAQSMSLAASSPKPLELAGAAPLERSRTPDGDRKEHKQSRSPTPQATPKASHLKVEDLGTASFGESLTRRPYRTPKALSSYFLPLPTPRSQSPSYEAQTRQRGDSLRSQHIAAAHSRGPSLNGDGLRFDTLPRPRAGSAGLSASIPQGKVVLDATFWESTPQATPLASKTPTYASKGVPRPSAFPFTPVPPALFPARTLSGGDAPKRSSQPTLTATLSGPPAAGAEAGEPQLTRNYTDARGQLQTRFHHRIPHSGRPPTISEPFEVVSVDSGSASASREPTPRRPKALVTSRASDIDPSVPLTLAAQTGNPTVVII